MVVGQAGNFDASSLARHDWGLDIHYEVVAEEQEMRGRDSGNTFASEGCKESWPGAPPYTDHLMAVGPSWARPWWSVDRRIEAHRDNASCGQAAALPDRTGAQVD